MVVLVEMNAVFSPQPCPLHCEGWKPRIMSSGSVHPEFSMPTVGLPKGDYI